MPYLKFISDKNLCSAVSNVIKIIETAEHDAQIKLHKNVVDPFSALFHGVTHSISYKEGMRKIQKNNAGKIECKRRGKPMVKTEFGLTAIAHNFVKLANWIKINNSREFDYL